MMKKLTLSLIVMTSLMLMVIGIVSAATLNVNSDYVNERNVIVAAADRLVALQSDSDAGWDWNVTGLTEHSAEPSGDNLYGVTALGLIDAYELTGNEAYYGAAENVANYLKGISRAIDSDVRFQSFDYRFLVEFSVLSGNNSYETHALSEWNWVKTNKGTYYADGNQSTIYNFWFTHTNPDSHGFAAWSAADMGLAALVMGDTSWAINMADELVLVGHLNSITNSDIYRFIGWGHALECLNAVDSTTYATEISSIITLLETEQDPSGFWDSGQQEGVAQDTAYAIMGLDAVGETETAQAGTYWLVNNQELNGGWGAVEEYSETDSEALQAIFDYIYVPDTYYTIQDAIDAASSGDTIEVADGSYTEDLVITTDNLELVGADKTTTTIKGVANVPILSWPLGVPNIEILANGVKIHGFTIEGPDRVEDTYSSGIILDGTNIEIYDNNFVTTEAANTDELAHAITTYSKEVIGFETADVSGLNIHDNTFTGSGAVGVEAIYINPHTGSGTITIDNNEFSGSIFVGVTAESGNVDVTNNIINSDILGWYGIRFMDSTYAGNYENILISGNDVQSFQRGIRVGNGLTGASIFVASILSNTLTNNDLGIWARQYGADVTATYNLISGNTVGIQNDGATEVNAEYNYWGTADGPSGEGPGTGDSVSVNVDYIPWCLNSECSNIGGEGQDFIALSVPDFIDYKDLFSTPGFETTPPQAINLTNVGSLDVLVTPIWVSGAEVFKRIKFSDDDVTYGQITGGVGVESVYTKTITAVWVSGTTFENVETIWTKIKIAFDDTLAKLVGQQTGTIYFQAIEA